ncbi:Mitochondrial import inner membrane translocase subunit TIM8 [Rhodotorula toruloides]|nr:Mitochondrial import inner membrane translocase subunit TIM8 [Rhodotorula toruloides]
MLSTEPDMSQQQQTQAQGLEAFDENTRRELQQFLEQEQTKARIQTQIHEFTDTCWDLLEMIDSELATRRANRHSRSRAERSTVRRSLLLFALDAADACVRENCSPWETKRKQVQSRPNRRTQSHAPLRYLRLEGKSRSPTERSKWDPLAKRKASNLRSMPKNAERMRAGGRKRWTVPL